MADPTQTFAYPVVDPHCTYVVPTQGSYASAPGGYPIDLSPAGPPPDYATATNKAATYQMPIYGQASQAPTPSLVGRAQQLPDDYEVFIGKWELIGTIGCLAFIAITLGCLMNPLFFLGLLTLIAVPIIYCWPDSDNIPPMDGDGYEAEQQPLPSYYQAQGQPNVYNQREPSFVFVDPIATLTPEYTATLVQKK